MHIFGKSYKTQEDQIKVQDKDLREGIHTWPLIS